jgi:hypothetical protein
MTDEPGPAPPQMAYTSLLYSGIAWSAGGLVPEDAHESLLGSDISLCVNGEWMTFTIVTLHASTMGDDTWQANEKVPPVYMPPPITPEEQPG